MKNLVLTPWVSVAPVLCLALLTAADYEFVTWKPDGRQCMDIPEDLRLCYNVGYQRMRIPNLLEHETIAEVKQQAVSWVPLVHKACHPGTQVLLCSLFAPVCLDTPIYPCRWLCEAVRDNCSPIMQAFGFPWPEMLNCTKFPSGDVCIAMNKTSSTETDITASGSCPACDNQMNTDGILEHICASEFAVKAKIKEVKNDSLDRKIILQKNKKLVRADSQKKPDLKKLVLYLKNGANCSCQQLENLKSNYLIMGRNVGKQYILTGIHKWDKSSKELKRALKKMKSHQCPTYESVF